MATLPPDSLIPLSPRSLARLKECDERLVRVILAVARRTSISVLCGHRTEADQNKAFDEGRSKLRWPQSKHNKRPSLACDVCPLPLQWDDIASFKRLHDEVMAEAERQGVELRSGADWNRNGRHDDETFLDWAHVELVEA